MHVIPQHRKEYKEYLWTSRYCCIPMYIFIIVAGYVPVRILESYSTRDPGCPPAARWLYYTYDFVIVTVTTIHRSYRVFVRDSIYSSLLMAFSAWKKSLDEYIEIKSSQAVGLRDRVAIIRTLINGRIKTVK